jgi:hypothetical protein
MPIVKSAAKNITCSLQSRPARTADVTILSNEKKIGIKAVCVRLFLLPWIMADYAFDKCNGTNMQIGNRPSATPRSRAMANGEEDRGARQALRIVGDARLG